MLSLILGIMLVGMTGFVLAENCTDSDGGLDYFVKGELTADNITYEDTCTDSNFIKEYFCDNPPIYYDNYYCPNGCNEGVCLATDDNDNNDTDDNDNNRSRRGLGQTIRGRVKAGVYTNEDGDQIRVRELAQNRYEFSFGNHSARTELEIDEETEGNRTKFKVKLNNGRNAEIKIMPNVASETALARLRLKSCNDTSINCSIELKEVGEGNKSRLIYEVKARKTFKVFGLFRNQEQVQTQIDAETGEEIASKRPWWVWMASESKE